MSKHMNDCIFFAGGYYYPSRRVVDKKGNVSTVVDNTKPRRFGIVHSGGTSNIPYLTKSSNGLIETSHHANLYRLSKDHMKAILVRYRCADATKFSAELHRLEPVQEVELTEEQIELIEKAIDSGHFYC